METQIITSRLEEIISQSGAKVWWLASWYPSRTDRWNGDFIQRHARGVATRIPLLVIHAIHDPQLVEPVQYELSQQGQLHELLVYFRHNGNVNTLSARISYNILFYKVMRRVIGHLVASTGKPSVLHVHVAMKMGRLAQWAGRKYSIPYLISEQSSEYFSRAKDGYFSRSFYYRWSVKSLLKGARGISNVSRSGADVLAGIAGRPTAWVRVIHNLADPSLFHFEPRYHEGQGVSSPFIFLHVSTWKDDQKNVSGMVRAFGKLAARRADFVLHMVGGGPEELKKIAAVYGSMPWLRLEGTMEHDLVAERMRRSSCFVLFSNHENFPCVIVEALCSGLPVVTSNAGGSAEPISSANGLVVEIRNEDDLTAALQNIMDRYSLFNRRSIAEDATDKYSGTRISLEFLAFYRDSGINY